MPGPDARDVVLREVRPGDLSALFEHQRDPEANRMAAFAARDRDAFEAHWARILADPSVVARTVLARGEVAGNIGSWDDGDTRLVGYWIGREFWGRGVATRALGAFVREDSTRPLSARVAEHNVVSIRVLEKCGFVAGGVETGEDGVRELVMRLDA